MIKFYDNPEDYKNNTILCNAWVAAAVIGSAVIGAGSSIWGSQNAASAQRDAADKVAGTQRGMFDETSSYLKPFRAAGEDALGKLQENNYFSTPYDVNIKLKDPTSIEAKAYDFTKTQGLKAISNSAAARGLGTSGAALKGAANFVTGLADNTYQNIFKMGTTAQQNAFTNLKSVVETGASAAAGNANLGANTANQISAAQTGAGNATAAASNAAGGAITNAANNVGGYYAYKGLYGGGYNPSVSPSYPGANSDVG